MRCKVCDKELTDFEATRRDANTYQILDMCNDCIRASDINTLDRIDLMTEDDLDCFDSTINFD